MRELHNRKAISALFFLVLAFPFSFAGFGTAFIDLGDGLAQFDCNAGQGYACHSIHWSDGSGWLHAYGSSAEAQLEGTGSVTVQYYSVGKNCSGEKCIYAVEPMKSELIELETAPTISLNSPLGGEQWNGVQPIDFNVSGSQRQELHLQIAYSPSSGSSSQQASDSFENTSKIASSSDVNVDTSAGQVKLEAGSGSAESTKSPGTTALDSGSGGEMGWQDLNNAKVEDGSTSSIIVGEPAGGPIMPCLSSDTLISTASGEKPIKDLKAGELVYSYDFETQEIKLNRVGRVWSAPISNAKNKYYHVYFSNGDIRATYNHFFFVGGKLKTAEDLKVGDELTGISGEKQAITKIAIEENYSDLVWDISVDGTHNYFANGVLVHNQGVYDHRVRIVKGGTAGSTDRANASSWPETLAYSTYGDSSDLWGETWAASEINSSGFGAVISAYGSGFDMEYTTYYLKATNFGFNIPEGASIDGIEVKFKKKGEILVSSGYAHVDHIQITVYYTESSGYAASGSLTSTNLLSGQSVSSIDSFDYNASSIPADTNIRVQFSQDNFSWFDSSGTENAWNALSQGSNSIDLSSLDWSGANFYYKASFASDGSNTPVLGGIAVNYTESIGAGSFTNIIVADLNLNDYANIPALDCDGSNWSSSTNCTYDWNTAAISDGSYFIDLNVWNSDGLNAVDSSDSVFLVDNTAPFTSFISPSGWQTADFNIALDCNDFSGSGCYSSRYRSDLGPWEKFGIGIASTEWWDGNWTYRSRIVFNNSGEAEKTDHSVLVRLTSSNFNFDVAKAGGIDIRARDANHAVSLDYFIDEFDATAQTGIVWVKVPTIDADSKTDYCYIYYGNAAASDAQASNWFS